MARENQGLQIALIGFVTVTIVLSVTTYLGFKNYSDSCKDKEVALTAKDKAENQNRTYEEQLKTLKKDIGAADTEAVDQIDAKFKDDMKAYGTGYPEDSLFYRKLLEKMKNTIDEKNRNLEDAKARIPEVKNKYDEDLKAKQVQNTISLPPGLSTLIHSLRAALSSSICSSTSDATSTSKLLSGYVMRVPSMSTISEFPSARKARPTRG